MPSSSAVPAAPAPVPAPAGENANPAPSAQLNRLDVQRGMSAVALQVKGCAMGQTGAIVTLRVVIGKDGNVLSAVPAGQFAGTPIGECAARVVSNARFRQSADNLTVSYPFKL